MGAAGGNGPSGADEDVDVARRAAILDNLPDLVIVVDGDGLVTFAGGRFGDGIALSGEELLGRGAVAFVHPDDVADVVSSLDYGRGYDEEGVLGPFVLRYRDRDGHERIADVMGLNRTSDPVINGMVLLLRDIVGAHSVEQAYQAMAEGASLGAVATHVLRAVEEPPITGAGWVVELTDDGPRLVAISGALDSLAPLVVEDDRWLDPVAAGTEVVDTIRPDAGPLAAAMHALGLRSLAAVPIALRSADRPELAIVATNRWNEPLSTNGQRHLRRYADALQLSLERSRLTAELEYRAHHDDLTGLANRSTFMAELRTEPMAAALLYLDLDGFKPVNDRIGHAAGDEVLVEIGARIAAVVGAAGRAARLGGDEFAVLLPGVGRDEAVVLADALLAAIAEPIELAAGAVTVGASIGIAVGAVAGLERLLEHADAAMYKAKAAGRRTWRVADDPT